VASPSGAVLAALATTLGAVVLAAGILAGVTVVCLRFAPPARLAAVGRLALSAYVAQSVVAAVVFVGFSRYGAPTVLGSEPPEAVDVKAVVDEILALYQAGSGAINFDVQGEAPLPPARARPSELKEVLVNLLENARAALPSGGDVVIALEGVEGGVRMSVHDDGVGIDPELLPRIFDPHFSTRSAGSGLGLAIVRRLVGSWGGRVWAENRPGGGTTVVVHMQRWPSPG
ncbi:MAG: ATP-binding protein, partial [Gemmatimonadota bacterium]